MDYTKKYIKYKKKYLDLKQELEGGGNKNKALAAVKQDGFDIETIDQVINEQSQKSLSVAGWNN